MTRVQNFYLISKLERVHYNYPVPPLLLEIIFLLKNEKECLENYERIVIGAIYCVLTIFEHFWLTLSPALF